MWRPSTTSWFDKLGLLKPAPYKPWRHSVRLTLGTTLPLLVGVMTNHVPDVIYIVIGAFLTAITVRVDPYRERFRQIAISTAIGVTGCFLGPAVSGHGPETLALLTVIALISGLISGYGGPFSTGALNMLVLSVVTSHLPPTVSSGVIALQFISGALLIVSMLFLVALTDGNRPERLLISNLLGALSALARKSAAMHESRDPSQKAALEAARRAVTDASKTAYTSLIEKRSKGRSRTRYVLQAANFLGLVNQLTMALLATTLTPETLNTAANRLDAIAAAYLANRKSRPLPDDGADTSSDGLLVLVDKVAATLWSEPAPSGNSEQQAPGNPVFSRNGFRNFRRRLILGPEVIISALKLTLCMAIAVILTEKLPGDHSYWLAMTVAIVLKPDFGSVFVRAIHRSIGTCIGVLIAAAIVTLVPEGMGRVAVIALLCIPLPWAGLRSYAAMVSLMTPVILLLIALAVPGSAESDVVQRLIDTLLGVAVALVFGFLIWPRSRNTELGASFVTALNAVTAFMTAATAKVPEKDAEMAAFRQNLDEREFTAYQRLSDLRTQLQKLVAEPPPSGREAAAWFPAVVGAERLCDGIAAYAGGRSLGDPPPDEKRAERAINALGFLSRKLSDQEPGSHVAGGREKDDAFGNVEAEIAWLFTFFREKQDASRNQDATAPKPA